MASLLEFSHCYTSSFSNNDIYNEQTILIIKLALCLNNNAYESNNILSSTKCIWEHTFDSDQFPW